MSKAPIVTNLGGAFLGIQDPDVGRPFVIEIEQGEAGRINIVGLHFSTVLSPLPLPNETLRKVSISRLEVAALRQRGVRMGIQLLAEVKALQEGAHLDIPPPRDQTLEGALDEFAEKLEAQPQPRPTRRKSLRLPIPTSKRFPDAFYERLAVLYIEAAEHGDSPVADLAEANDRPYKTVAAWVREARRRGKLPPGRAGKAG